MKIPWGTPSVSSATVIGYTNTEQSILGLLHQDVSPANSTNFGAAWTEVDSGTNVNVDGDGVLTMKGNNTYNGNGMSLASGVTLGEGYFEVKINQATSSPAPNLVLLIKNSAGLVTGINIAGTAGFYTTTGGMAQSNNGTVYNVLSWTMAVNTWYTIRFYVLKNSAGAYSKFRITVTGGLYSNTVVFETDLLATAAANPLFFTLQRYSNSADLISAKEFYWYSGYSTASPIITWVADAGAGKTYDSYDLTAIAMPSGFPTTNMMFQYLFDDAGTTWSGTNLSLANLNAVGKISERHRYIGIRAYLVSDGVTQIQAPDCGPNSDTGTDGAGDFPAVGNVRPPDTVQGTEGTLANLAATDAAYVALENARNNDNGTVAADLALTKSVKIRNVTTNGASDKLYSAAEEAARNTGAAVGIIKSGETIKQINVDYLGTYVGSQSAPSIPTLGTPIALSSTSIRAYFTWAADATKIYLEISTDQATWTAYEMTAGTYYRDFTALTANTTYYIRARSWNSTGYSAYAATKTVKTWATAYIPDATAISQLFQSIRESILDIVDSDNAAVFASDNVIIGEVFDLDSRESTDYPCVEIFQGKLRGGGENYESQRQISNSFAFEIVLHTHAETAQRNDGTDIVTLTRYASAILRQMYRFVDHGDNPPCTGFLFANPDYSVDPQYEVYSEHVNSEIITISFRVDTQDTEL